jgi:hypothetical protein
MHQGVKHQPRCVDQDVTLLPLDFLARIIPRRVDPTSPFSALLMLWLSITAAVGLAVRPANSRHAT